MNKTSISLSLVTLLAAGIGTASAQRATISVPVPGVTVERDYRDGRDYRDRDYRDDRPDRSRYEIERLNGEVRQVRLEIGNSGDRRIRYMFSRVVRATDRLTYEARRGDMRGWEVRRRAEEIRSDLYRVQRELRMRRDDRRGDWR